MTPAVRAARQLIERVAAADAIYLYGFMRYNRDRNSLTVPMRRGTVELSVAAIEDCMAPEAMIRGALRRRR